MKTSNHKCSYCNIDPGTNKDSIVWLGFVDQDTNEKVCNSCKEIHYNKKFSNPDLKGLYSEFPLTIFQA